MMVSVEVSVEHPLYPVLVIAFPLLWISMIGVVIYLVRWFAGKVGEDTALLYITFPFLAKHHKTDAFFVHYSILAMMLCTIWCMS